MIIYTNLHTNSMESVVKELHYETVLPILREVLTRLSAKGELSEFRLVGGTNLSLRFGHRMSDDIDYFTPQEYGTADFDSINKMLRDEFDYMDGGGMNVGFGNTYYVGNTSEDGHKVKLDLMYTDPFLNEAEVYDGVQFASVEDIIAMKLNAITDGDGRKKDFWDIHFLLGKYSLKDMLDLHERRHPWEHERSRLLKDLNNFSKADKDPNPRCLLGKEWQQIKLDLIDEVFTLLEDCK